MRTEQESGRMKIKCDKCGTIHDLDLIDEDGNELMATVFCGCGNIFLATPDRKWDEPKDE